MRNLFRKIISSYDYVEFTVTNEIKGKKVKVNVTIKDIIGQMCAEAASDEIVIN